MKIEIRTPQVPRNSWVHPPMADWLKKIGHFQTVHMTFVKKEDDLLKGVEGRDWVIALDERGDVLSSRQFAQKLQVWIDSGKSRLLFVVGGPFGLPAEVLDRANARLSLSHFVFNQELALAVLTEQVFRGLSILQNHPYHND